MVDESLATRRAVERADGSIVDGEWSVLDMLRTQIDVLTGLTPAYLVS
jgi:hypothetical protein